MNLRGWSLILLQLGLAVAPTLAANTATGQRSPSRQSLSRPLGALPSSTLDRSGRPPLAALFGNQPPSFEANRGQTDRRVKFLSRGPGYTLFLTPMEAVLALRSFPGQGKPGQAMQPSAFESDKPIVTAVRIKLVGGDPDARLTGLEELPGKSNYFIGNDSSKWRTNVSTYERVQARGIYPGIDLVYYGKQRELEEDFVVAAGADPRVIALGISGAEKIFLNAEGELVLRTAGGELRLRKPAVYQQAAGVRQEIASGYRLEGKNRVVFELGPYDASQPLIIDPTLAYSTYLGGSSPDGGNGVAVDSAGNAYVTGFTESSNFPGASLSAIQPSLKGCEDAFVAKVKADGSGLVYSTYLGGSGLDGGNAIAVDSSGNAYVTGFTTSSNFPGASSSAIQSSFSGSRAAFVAKISADGGTLDYATYLGGSIVDAGTGIAVDSSGNAYVTGFTESLSFPVAGSTIIQSFLNGLEDAFVAKINATGSALVYSTYLGGSFFGGGSGIAVDSGGNAYVTGFTQSIDFPGAGTSTIQSTLKGFENGFVAKVNAAGSALVYSTYLGGSGFDAGNGIAVDSAGNAYVTGFTSSSDFTGASTSTIQSMLKGSQNAFVVKVNSTGSALAYSTYLGGTGSDAGASIAVDSAGNAYVTGSTSSTNFPGTSTSTIQSSFGGGSADAFVTEVNAAGSALIFSTYLGGSSGDAGAGIAVDSGGNAYVTGITGSSGAAPSGFPTTTGALQTSLSGHQDAFVAKIAPLLAFSAFSANLAIQPGPPPGFHLVADFTLGTGGSIYPPTQPVTLQVGTYSVTIPPGSFKPFNQPGAYLFTGTINGVSLPIHISNLGGLSFEFRVEAQPVDLTGVSNPVSVTLTIGDNTGTIPVMASVPGT